MAHRCIDKYTDGQEIRHCFPGSDTGHNPRQKEHRHEDPRCSSEQGPRRRSIDADTEQIVEWASTNDGGQDIVGRET